MDTKTLLNTALRSKAALIFTILLGGAVLGGLIWWHTPGNTARRYRRMSMVELNQIVDQNPNDALAARTLALRRMGEGDAVTAEFALRNAMTLNPNDPELATGLGELLLKNGQYVEAFQILKSVASRFPHYQPGRAALGRFYMSQAAYVHASTEYEAVVAQDKNADEAWYQLAECYLQRQQSAKAQSAIDTALRLHPDEPRYLALKGSIDVTVGNVDAGIAETCRAAQLAPQNATIAFTLTNLLLNKHRNEADLAMAEQMIGRLEQLKPDDPLLPVQQGELERLRQHWLPAAHYLEKARAKTPDQDAVYFALSQVYRRLNRNPEADQMIKTFRHRQQLRLQMGDIRVALGNRPNDPDLYAQMALIQLQLREWNQARGSIRAGLAIDPSNVRLQQELRILGTQTASEATLQP